ncbi:site-specific integrase [Sandarakinorhabdus limnophila]|uniref:tyrosine-type recombinase/integrase n=1 Tax=Sandarakinorhabdus limnophila TaxID=210512 RepID=UPI0026EAFC3D|nr:site-specific integrase [Sandarakinorhabdus limnophila]
MARKLTAKQVENVKPNPDKVLEIADGEGLYLVVQRSGTKSWAFRYRFGGKGYNMTLGREKQMTLKEARAVADEAREKVLRGVNPLTEQRAAKQDKANADADRRNKLDKLVREYHRRDLAKLKSGEQVKGFLERVVLNPWEVKGIKHEGWADRDIYDIAKRDIRDLVRRIEDSGRLTTANRVLAHLHAFLNWCVAEDIIAANPATGIQTMLDEKPRDRVLSDVEIKLFWLACEAVGQPFGPLFKMLLLTGQRRGEVAGMTQSEINGSVWHLDSKRTKNARAHDVPLSSAALAVLESVDVVLSPRNDRYIFTTTGKTQVSGFSKSHAAVHGKMVEIAEQDAGEDVPIEIKPWRLHDLRRTCATGLASLRIPVRVTEAVLNHVSGTAGGIVSVYQRHDYADEKREALEAWGNYVMRLVQGGADNVVQIKGAVS